MMNNSKADFVTAASLAHPLLYKTYDKASEKTTSSVVNYLRSNKVIFRSFSNFGSIDCFSKVANINQDYTRYVSLKDGITEVVNLLNNAGIEAVFLKSSGTLPLDSDNFDLLIHENDIIKAHELLSKDGFSQVAFYREPFKVLYRKSKLGQDYLALHLHTRIAWAGIEFVDAKKVWAFVQPTVRDGTTFRFFKPEIHIPITLAHAFYENGTLKLSDIFYVFDSLYKKYEEIDFLKMLKFAEQFHWNLGFNSMLLMTNILHNEIFGFEIMNQTTLEKIIRAQSGRVLFSESKNLVNRMMKNFETTKCLPILLPTNIRKRHFIFQAICRSDSIPKKVLQITYVLTRTLPNKGRKNARFCIMGLDGVGKTTHSQYLLNCFEKRGYSTSYSWNRQNSLLLRKIKKFKTKETVNANDVLSNKVRPQTLKKNRVINQIKDTLVIADYLLGLKWNVLRKGKSADVLLYDRWSLDNLVDNTLDVPIDSFFFKTIKRLNSNFSPKSDFQIILKASPNVLLKRKPGELDLELISRKTTLYDVFSKEYNIRQLRTDENFDSVQMKMLELALDAFYSGKAKGLAFEYDKELNTIPNFNFFKKLELA